MMSQMGAAQIPADKIERAKTLLNTVRHAAMATVNEDGSPHNTPYFFMCSPDLKFLYWGSQPGTQHSQNVARTGQIFVVLYDAQQKGGLYIRADDAHITEGQELEEALAAHNARKAAEGKAPLPLSYYQDGRQHMYKATARQFWIYDPERDEEGIIIRDMRREIAREDLLA